MRTLVLNAGYEPLAVVSFRRAIVLVLAGKAMVVHQSEQVVRSSSLSVQRPLVIILTRYIRIPFGASVPVSRAGVLRRDQYRCAYCQGRADTVDHVVPRSKGGASTWENLVACCRKCNTAKSDRSLREQGWTLRVAPHAPRGARWRFMNVRGYDETWDEYLGAA